MKTREQKANELQALLKGTKTIKDLRPVRFCVFDSVPDQQGMYKNANGKTITEDEMKEEISQSRKHAFTWVEIKHY